MGPEDRTAAFTDGRRARLVSGQPSPSSPKIRRHGSRRSRHGVESERPPSMWGVLRAAVEDPNDVRRARVVVHDWGRTKWLGSPVIAPDWPAAPGSAIKPCSAPFRWRSGYKINPSPLDLGSPHDVLDTLSSGQPIDPLPTSGRRRLNRRFQIGSAGSARRLSRRGHRSYLGKIPTSTPKRIRTVIGADRDDIGRHAARRIGRGWRRHDAPVHRLAQHAHRGA